MLPYRAFVRSSIACCPLLIHCSARQLLLVRALPGAIVASTTNMRLSGVRCLMPFASNAWMAARTSLAGMNFVLRWHPVFLRMTIAYMALSLSARRMARCGAVVFYALIFAHSFGKRKPFLDQFWNCNVS